MQHSKLTIMRVGLATAFTGAMLAFMPCNAYADAASDLKAADAAVQEAQSAYDEAVAKQNDLQSQIDALTQQIADIENQLPDKQKAANKSIRDMYVYGNELGNVMTAIATGKTLPEVIDLIANYDQISTWNMHQVNDLISSKNELEQSKAQLETSKQEQDEAVNQANTAKDEAISNQGKAREAVDALQKQNTTAQQVLSGSSTKRAATSSSWSDAESAKAFIVGKESGGRYNAQNGKYYGAYQLTISYLNGDLSPENQDRVAENYVNSRYGGWIGAAEFWQAHGWY